MPEKIDLPSITDSRHPTYYPGFFNWQKWRMTYNGGEEFRREFLKRFSTRETKRGFEERLDMTPIPGFAKSAVNDIRNAIFQRLNDVVRRGGSNVYSAAINGERRGVDGRGSTMNYFLGNEILTDLLVMGMVGVFVDMPQINGPTLADSIGKQPYLYKYAREDILNYSYTKPEEQSEFQSILLRDTVFNYDSVTLLPTGTVQRYRMLWINKNTGKVNLRFFNSDGVQVDAKNELSDKTIQLELTRIPFVMFNIGDSLIKDVADHQIALLNLGSSDVNYALHSNFPFYTEQRDERSSGAHLKRVATDGTATTGGQGSESETVSVGVRQGRYYPRDTERPGFIAPPSEPLLASLKLQEKLEHDIRKLVNLAVQNMGARASAESKSVDNQGLENGLAFIGLVLEGGERLLASYWAAYEEKIESRRQLPTIKYPDRYSLKSDEDRLSEADKLAKLMNAVPGRVVKRELSKNIVSVLLGSKTNSTVLAQIYKDIDEAPYTSSDPDMILAAKEAGLVGEKTASIALGFNEDEHIQAQKDHVARVARIAEASGVEAGPGAASRGVDDLSPDPANEGAGEKLVTRQTDQKETTNKPVRGEGKATKEEA
jgi:hypothetical protein